MSGRIDPIAGGHGARAASGATRPVVRLDVFASVCGALASVLLVFAIYAGSGSLRNFDAALIGYATAVVFLAFGVTYRYVVWVRSPPARRYLVGGWQAFVSPRNFLRFPALVPRALIANLALQTFIRQRGVGRWLAHQALFWGVVAAFAITFPLTFGWIHFRSVPGTTSGYVMHVVGRPVFSFDALSIAGWLTFHALDITAVLVIGGAAYFLWRRFRNREAMTGQTAWHDLIPLLGLVVISVTGLLLTFSTVLLHGRYFDFLALLHMASVVLTLVFIPFGKFFHIVQRPASIGVEVYKRAALERTGTFQCVRCGEAVESRRYVEDLHRTIGELGMRHGGWVRTCPRCKRLERGARYLDHVKGGFR